MVGPRYEYDLLTVTLPILPGPSARVKKEPPEELLFQVANTNSSYLVSFLYGI